MALLTLHRKQRFKVAIPYCLFIELPEPWNVVYHVLSEGFFAIWIIRILVIRNRYFKLMTSY